MLREQLVDERDRRSMRTLHPRDQREVKNEKYAAATRAVSMSARSSLLASASPRHSATTAGCLPAPHLPCSVMLVKL